MSFQRSIRLFSQREKVSLSRVNSPKPGGTWPVVNETARGFACVRQSLSMRMANGYVRMSVSSLPRQRSSHAMMGGPIVGRRASPLDVHGLK